MMIHLAEDLAESHQAQPSVNIAVAVIDEPSFVGKSIKLQPYLRSRVPNETRIKLAFVLGTDTITRFFAPRFYPSLDSMLRSIRHFFLEPAQGGEGSEIVCARRSSTLSEEEEQEFLQTEEVKEWVDVGAVKLIDIGEEEAKMSSTKVREGIKNYETLQWISRWEDMCCPSVANYIKDQHLYSIE
ncbi:hypothetical protein FRB90_004497 [Tulasnella sp. 427]|nr:hypothetical protein FRB90_004497 [Tulasnella sp. 427]